MGKQVHLERIEQLFDKSPVVDFKSIERIIGVKNSYAKLLLHNMLKKGKIAKIGKGMYTKHNETSLAVFSFKPAYLGLQSALSHHGLWEQETIPVIITTRKARRGIRRLMEGNVLVRNINEKHFFGFEHVREGDFYLPYSTIEKTFIDMIVFNERFDEETLKKMKKKIDKARLSGYLKEYSQRTRNKVLKKMNIPNLNRTKLGKS